MLTYGLPPLPPTPFACIRDRRSATAIRESELMDGGSAMSNWRSAMGDCRNPVMLAYRFENGFRPSAGALNRRETGTRHRQTVIGDCHPRTRVGGRQMTDRRWAIGCRESILVVGHCSRSLDAQGGRRIFAPKCQQGSPQGRPYLPNMNLAQRLG